MNVVQRLLQLSPVSFKQPPKTQTAPSSIPYRICSSRKATKLPPKPTRHQAKPTEPLINYVATVQPGESLRPRLWKSCEGEILVGGRDLAKGKALAAGFDNRASAVHLDILDVHSLDDFCSRCSIIVNCAGPVMVFQDRVAQAAFRRGCHYIDAAGMSLVRERMLPHSREIEGSGLSFVISAGWTPGLTELLPVYANAQARTKLDSIESMMVYFSDSGEWSDNALRDAAWFIH